MGYLQELGPLAIASRLKSLTDKLVREMLDIYHGEQLDFEPRWFTFVHLLNCRGPISITQIARELDQTHPAANQVANALERKGLVVSRRDKRDNRKRIIELTPRGLELIDRMKPLWLAVERAVRELLEESDPGFLERVKLIESRLAERTMKERITRKLKEQEPEPIEIVSFRPELAPHFRSLNEEWLNEHFRVEAEDEKLLSDPRQAIIASGGTIVFARNGDKVVGTGALLHLDDNTCELTKMAVAPSYQGRKIGRKLLEHLIAEAKRKKYTKMILLTSPKLERAVSLYRSAGFIEMPPGSGTGHNYERCSIFMEFHLTNKLNG